MPDNNNDALVVRVDTAQFRRMSLNNTTIPDLSADAAKATESERHMTLWQALKLYPKAVAWSAFFSTAIIMEGFDIVLIANLLAVPAFKRAFGEQLPNGSYEITAAWQTGLTNGAYAGEIIGLMINGIVAEKFGYRKTMIGALSAVTALIFIVFFTKSIEQLCAGLVLLGIPWGVFQTLTATYAAEVCPVSLRAYLTTYINLCWVIGQFLASGVLKGVSSREDQWAYRIPYALQWIWPIPLIVGIALAPESPWWLVRKDRREDAKKQLLRLTKRNANGEAAVGLDVVAGQSASSAFNPDETIAMMVHTNEMEKAEQSGTSYWDCFKGVELRRTETCAVTWFIQSFCGATFMGFSTYFYSNAGLDTSNAFSLSLAQYGIGAIGTFCAWALMSRFGRRTLYVWGLAGMTVILVVIGGLGLISGENKAAQWGIGSLLLLYTGVYDSTVGPVCYSLVTELASTRLRQKTVVLARNLYNIGSIIGNIITPRMLNPGAWNWGAKSGFFWAGCCFLCFVWTYFRLPEPKGRSYGELDALFAKKISARKFAETKVDLFLTQEKVNGEENEKEFREKKEDVDVRVERT